MTRLTGPDDSYRLVYLGDGTARAQGLSGRLYADAAGTTAADVLLADGTAVPVDPDNPAALVTVDTYSRWPRLQFPASGADTVYGSVNGGPIVPLLADLDSRLDATTALAAAALPLTGGTIAGNLAVGDGTVGRTVTLASSFAGGENTTDSTSRIDLYSYQRAQKNAADGITPASFGEVIRIYSRRWDSKQMVAWYGPTSYDPTTHLPSTADTVWFWMGAHYEANDHTSIHGHWSVEVPDSTGQMQTRMELRIWDPVTGQFGMDRTILKVNAADMIVACDNGSLQIGASAGTNKNVYFTNDTLGAVSGRRWLVQADGTAEAGSNVGTDFRLLRYSDTGSQIDTALFVKRSTGQVGVGNIIAPAAKLDVTAAGSYHTVQAAQTTTATVNYAAYSAQLGLVTNRLFDGRVIGDGSARIVIKGDGSINLGPGDGSGQDVNVYREAANVLKTDDHLYVNSTAGAATYANLPRGVVGRSESAGLTVGSSYAGGDDDGTGTDSTGRINLYSYQRANVGSFGETIRNFAMRADAKSMQAFYIPVQTANKQGGYDPTTRDPMSSGVSWKPVVWQGAHYEANDHTSIHGHWELEIADSTGALQGRLEIPFIDQSRTPALNDQLDQAVIGIDYTNIRTNLADFTVRAQNIATGNYSGQNTALRIGGNNTVNKDILLSISSDMQNSGRRWGIRANTTTETGTGNTGTDLQILRYDDTGAALGTGLGIERSTGNATFGGPSGGRSARLAAVWSASGTHGFSAQPSATPGAAAGFDAQMTVTTDRAFQAQITSDTSRRWVVYGDGKTEWGDGTTRDANLYRSAASRLKTDTAFQVGTTLGIGAVPSGTDAVTITQTVDANGIASTNTNATGNTATPHLRLQSITTSSLAWTTRISTDTASRFLSDMTGKMQWGDGTAAKDVNLYRSAAGALKTDTAFVVGGALTVAGAGLGAAPQPSDQGLLTWSADPFGATQDRPLSDGVLYLHKVKLNPGGLVSNVVIDVSIAGTTLANCYVSLFDSAGTQLAISADVSTTFQSTGLKVIPFAVAYTAATGAFHVGVQVGSHGTTSPSFRGGTGTIGLAGAGGTAPYRFSQTGSGLTTVPASFTPGSVSISAQPLWVGLS